MNPGLAGDVVLIDTQFAIILLNVNLQLRCGHLHQY